jgi:hypothetical protein
MQYNERTMKIDKNPGRLVSRGKSPWGDLEDQ